MSNDDDGLAEGMEDDHDDEQEVVEDNGQGGAQKYMKVPLLYVRDYLLEKTYPCSYTALVGALNSGARWCVVIHATCGFIVNAFCLRSLRRADGFALSVS
jgi:hypothetical protein